MWRFVIFLAIGLASSDKLDRNYLPPPGSKFSGGRPSDLDVPLEFPKESYVTGQTYSDFFPLENQPQQTTQGTSTSKDDSSFDRSFDRKIQVDQNSQRLGPFTTKDRKLTPADLQPTFGINRGVGLQEEPIQSHLPLPDQPNINQYLPSSFTLPTTTTSYAFTQTTTFSPIESFDATVSPITSTVASTSVDNLPDILHQNANLANLQNSFDVSSIPNQFVQGIGQDANTISQQHNGHQDPSFQPIVQFPSQFNQNKFNSHSGNQYLPTTTDSPITSSTQLDFENQGFGQHLGVQPPSSGFDHTSYKNTLQKIPQTNTVFANQDTVLNNNLPSIDTQVSNKNLQSIQNSIQQGYNKMPTYQSSSQFRDDNISRGFISPEETITQNEKVFQNPSQQSFDQNNYHEGANIFVPSTSVAQDFSEHHPGSGTFQANFEKRPIYPDINIPTITTPTQHFLGSSTSDVPGSNVFQTTNSKQDFLTPSAPNLNDRFPDFSKQSTANNIPRKTLLNSADYFDNSKKMFDGPTRSERFQAESDRKAEILSYENILTPEGYSYSYDTSNGIHADESAITVDGTKASGSYSYTGDDGKVYSVVYTANENGFLPHGDHLPTPPPIPKEIQRVIEEAERDREAGIIHNGFYDEEKYGYKKYVKPTYTKKIENNFDNINENFKNIEEELEIGDPINPTIKHYLNQRKRPVDKISKDGTEYTQFKSNNNKENSYLKTNYPDKTPAGNSKDKNIFNTHENSFESEMDLQEYQEKEVLVGRPKVSFRPFVSSTEKYLSTTLADNDTDIYNNDNSFSYKQTTFRPYKKPDVPIFGLEQRIKYDSIIPNTQRVETSSHQLQNNDYSAEIPSNDYEEKYIFPGNSKMHSKQTFDAKTSENGDNEDDDDGYHYTPPQTRFDLNNNPFQPHFLENVNSRNQFKVTDQKSTIRPFMTPNVSRNYESYNNNDEDQTTDEDDEDFIENVSDSKIMTHGEYSSMKNNLSEPKLKYHPETSVFPLDKQSKPLSQGQYKLKVDNHPGQIPSNDYAKNTYESIDGITKPEPYSKQSFKSYYPGTKNNVHTYSTTALPATDYTSMFDYQDTETNENPTNKIKLTGDVSRGPNKSTVSPAFTNDDSTYNDRNTSLEPTRFTTGFVQTKMTKATPTIPPTTISVTSRKLEEDRPTTGLLSVKPNSRYSNKPNVEKIPSTTYRPRVTHGGNLPGYNVKLNSVTPAQEYLEKSTKIPSQIRINQRVQKPNYNQFNVNENYSPDFEKSVDNKSIDIKNNPKYENTSSQRLSDDQESYTQVPSFGRQGSVIQKPYSSTTEKVFGENFSGPKQAQTFDPKFGYYY